MWNDRFLHGRWGMRGIAYEPMTMIAGASLALSAVGTGISAMGTLASGDAAAESGRMQQQAANYQASQIESNASSEIGAAQRTMLDTQEKTRLARSSLVAGAAANGVRTDVGSPAADEEAIAARGSYQSMMDLWNGENRSTGLLNQAKGIRYSGVMAQVGGEMAKTGSQYSAAGTLASGIGSAGLNYAKFNNPSRYG